MIEQKTGIHMSKQQPIIEDQVTSIVHRICRPKRTLIQSGAWIGFARIMEIGNDFIGWFTVIPNTANGTIDDTKRTSATRMHVICNPGNSVFPRLNLPVKCEVQYLFKVTQNLNFYLVVCHRVTSLHVLLCNRLFLRMTAVPAKFSNFWSNLVHKYWYTTNTKKY